MFTLKVFQEHNITCFIRLEAGRVGKQFFSQTTRNRPLCILLSPVMSTNKMCTAFVIVSDYSFLSVFIVFKGNSNTTNHIYRSRHYHAIQNR